MPDYDYYLGYLKYFLFSRHKFGYGIHSPFVFDLIVSVFKEKLSSDVSEKVELLRKKIIKSNIIIDFEDYGAKASIYNNKKRNISKLASYAAVNRKYGELLHKLVKKFEPENIIEIGTSLGFSSMYMSLASNDTTIYTVEGCKQSAKIALENFQALNLDNIKLSKGKFDEVLPSLIENLDKIDLVFFDGNHRKAPTIKYFNICLKKVHNGSIFVFDDINLSAEMRETWTVIKSNNLVKLTVNIYKMGIVFFNKNLSKEDYIIRY